MVEKLAVEIVLEGGEQMQRQFAAATTSISKLGNTAEEAFAGASAAAQKFSASTTELQQVESVISALAARARDGSLSFSELAKNYDAARQSAGSFVAGAAKVEQATKNISASATEARAAVNALAQGLNVMGAGPMGRIATAVANIGTRFGALAIAAAAVGGTAAALIKFASAAEETEKALTQLQKVSGQSFASLSALATVFAKGGTPLKQFASEFGNLSEKIAKAGEQLAQQDAIKKQAEDAAKGLRVTSDETITLEQRVKTLLETLSTASPAQQWLQLADVFKNLGDTVERARIGQALGLSPETIATLSQGSAKLQELQANAERLGLTLTTSNQQALQGMAQGWNEFSALLSAVFQKIGAVAAPAFTAILASFQPVMQQIVEDFQKLPLDQAISNLGTRLAPAFSALGEVLTPIVTAMGTAAGTAFANAVLAAIKSGLIPTTSLWDAILNDFIKFGESIVKNAEILGEKIKRALRALGLGGGGSASPATSGGGEGFAGGGFIGGRGSGTSDSNLAWLSRGEYIMPASAVRQPGVLSFLEALRRSGSIPGFAEGGAVGGTLEKIDPTFSRIMEQLSNAINPIIDQILRISKTVVENAKDMFDPLQRIGEQVIRSLEDVFNTLRDNANRVADELKSVAKSLAGVLTSMQGTLQKKARGGLLGGRGSGTSDSNLAWVSRGEHIMPSHAVRQPGVLAFLEALRRSGGNLSAVLDGMGRFALGGMIRGPMPAFASGGLAGGMSNVTIQFPGLPAIGGLRASSDVVDQLHRAAALAQVRSGGRKPSRYS